jgi:hypothetical protein
MLILTVNAGQMTAKRNTMIFSSIPCHGSSNYGKYVYNSSKIHDNRSDLQFV